MKEGISKKEKKEEVGVSCTKHAVQVDDDDDGYDDDDGRDS